MKTFIVILFLIVTLSNCNGCKQRSWLPQNVFETITSKTSQFTDYVMNKGRVLKRFYENTLRDKINYVLGSFTNQQASNMVQDYVEDKQPRMKRKLKDYAIVNENEKRNENLIDRDTKKKGIVKQKAIDPHATLTTPQMIALNGYPAESHTIITDDGYILTIHRIPYSKKSTDKVSPKKTVLLHHGLLGSSADWVIAGPEKSLAYYLSDAGYDVWMANVRGNTYSRAHVWRPVDSFGFWNFTFHEVSQHDLPAVIDHLITVKGWDVKINYIGHSMGTTILFALLSTKTQYNRILRAGFALAPVAYMMNVRSPIRLLAKYANDLEYLLKLLGENEFLPHENIISWLSEHTCEINHYEAAICENTMFVICGFDKAQFNSSLLPLILGHSPAGASTKTLVHYAQEIQNKGRFQQYDFGPEGNIRQYGSVTPPAYPVNKITLPIGLLSAQNDWLASDIAVTTLFFNLANAISHYIVPMKEFNHIDFMIGKDAPTLVYKKLLQLMEDVEEPYQRNLIYYR